MGLRQYIIRLISYYPDNNTKGRRKGEILSDRTKYLSSDDFEKVKAKAREMWIENAKQYKGSIMEVWAHYDDVYPPRIGPLGALMHENNFKHFDMGIPDKRPVSTVKNEAPF